MGDRYFKGDVILDILRKSGNIINLDRESTEAKSFVRDSTGKILPFSSMSVRCIMEIFDAGKLFGAMNHLATLAQVLPENCELTIPLGDYDTIKDLIDHICAELDRLDLPTSLASARELRSIIHDNAEPFPERQPDPGMRFGVVAASRYRSHSFALVNRFRDELSNKMVMLLPSNKLGYFDGSVDIFPHEVQKAFPSVEYDANEACKCFALARYTACVFQSMRVLEAGLNALGGALGIPVASNWNTALDQIEKEIRRRNSKTHGPTWKTDEEPFYSEAATHFRMVKNAWRNHTMHLKEHYEESRAKGILNSVGDLMRHLSHRLHE